MQNNPHGPEQAAAAAAKPPARLTSIYGAAKYFQVSERTVQNWLREGHFKGYLVGPRKVVVDLDEIEAFLAAVPSTVARDGRKPFGPKAHIVDLSGAMSGAQS